MRQFQQKFFKTSAILVICYLLFVIFVLPVAAQVAAPAGFEETLALPATDLRVIIARIINVALGFLGLVAVVIVLYGGFQWMTAAGNEEKVAKAKKTLINGAIGLVIIFLSLIIVRFVFRALGATEEELPLAARQFVPARVGGGALGTGMIENHYPSRGQTNVPRNTKIVITFKEPIEPSSISQAPAGKYFDEIGGNRVPVAGLTLKNNAIQIIKAGKIEGSVRESKAEEYVKAGISFTSDLRTWVIAPNDYLGSPTENISYHVYLCGTKTSGNCSGGGIKLLAGGFAFDIRFPDYEWGFETGTFLDITPPYIVSLVPKFDNEQDGTEGQAKDRRDKPRNTLIQINFSEPVLPTVVSGKTMTDPLPPAGGSGGSYLGAAPVLGTFDVLKVSVKDGAGYLAGEWQIGNQYQTTEFTSADKCGRNACGQDIFCLPGPRVISVEAQAASLKNPPDPSGGFISAGLLDGIEDLAGNSLDGKKDNQPRGARDFYNLNNQSGEGDNLKWSFWTLASIDITSPIIEKTEPPVTGGRATSGVKLISPVEITFSKPMSIATLNNKNISLSGTEIGTAKPWDTWWQARAENLDTNNDDEPEKTKAILVHGGFWKDANYQTSANQNVKDIYQNCFYPSSGTGCGALSGEMPYCCNGTPMSCADYRVSNCASAEFTCPP